MKRRELMAAAVVGAVCVAALRSAWPQGGSPLLPELVPWTKTGAFLYDAIIAGAGADRKLVFSGTTANVGSGPFEINPGAVPGVAYQRIYDSLGGYVDVPIGELMNEMGEGPHYHNFANFDLRGSLPGGRVGGIVATSPKGDFALHDTMHYETHPPGTPAEAIYPRGDPGFPDRLGISVGWADIYAATDAEQYIPLAGVADGDYWLEMIIDPNNQIRERDKSNNTARVPIRIQGGSVTWPPAPGPLPDPSPVAAASGPRAFPNPWRSDRHSGGINFVGLAPGSVVRIFSLSGRRVRSLSDSNGTAIWDLRTDAGETVVSGFYLYRTTAVDGAALSGRVAVIR